MLTGARVKAILDANRNSLMLLELRFSVWTLGLTSGTFIAALYGMNLKNWIEEHDLGFWGVSATCAVVSVVVLVMGLTRLRKVQRVSMWGNAPTSSTKHLSSGRSGQAMNDMLDEKGLPWATAGGGLHGHMQSTKHHMDMWQQMQQEQQQQIEKSKTLAKRMAERSAKLHKKQMDKVKEMGEGPLFEKHHHPSE
jgi:magnesium transporter